MEGYFPGSDIPAFVSTCGDPSLTSDLMDTSIYASSPNSLFMYDQEKADMQSSMGLNTTCTSIDPGMSEEFDLNAQYEISQDFSNLPMSESGPSTSHTVTSSMLPGGYGSSWEGGSKKKDIYIKPEVSRDLCLTPTLAELNMNPSMDLLEDINSYINVEMSQYLTPTKVDDTIVKSEPVSCIGRDSKEINADILGQAGGSSQAVFTPLVGVPATQKSKPIEIPRAMKERTRTMSYPESFTPMTAIKPELIVPHSAPMSSSAPLSTIKEIDISDFTTLQNLLKRSEPSQARVQTSRRRTVSETQLLQKQHPPQRKRSVATAGLESMDRKWEEIKEFLDMETKSEKSVFPPAPPVRRERTRYGMSSFRKYYFPSTVLYNNL